MLRPQSRARAYPAHLAEMLRRSRRCGSSWAATPCHHVELPAGSRSSPAGSRPPRREPRSADRLKRTPFHTALFSADDGTVFLGSRPVGVVVVLGEREVNVGLVQWALRKALATLEGTWGETVPVPATPEDM